MVAMSSRRRMFALALVGVSVLAVTLAFLFTWWEQRAERERTTDFARVTTEGVYTDREGRAVTLDAYRGKPFLVFLWASWCPACGDQLSLFSKIAGERIPGVEIVAVNRKEDRALMNDYLASIDEPTNLTYIVDTTDHMFATLEGRTAPEVIVYGADGMEKYHLRGTISEEELRAVIQEFITTPSNQ